MAIAHYRMRNVDSLPWAPLFQLFERDQLIINCGRIAAPHWLRAILADQCAMPPLVFGEGPPPTGAHPRGPVDARTGARTPATTDGLTDGAAVCPACPVPRRLSLPYLSWVRARHCVGWGTTIHLLLFLPPRAGRGPLLSPSLPPDQRAARAQRDGDFVCTVLLINPALRSRDKARELSAALHWTRDEVYETAEGVGISLRACSSHAEMAAPRGTCSATSTWNTSSGACCQAPSWRRWLTRLAAAPAPCSASCAGTASSTATISSGRIWISRRLSSR